MGADEINNVLSGQVPNPGTLALPSTPQVISSRNMTEMTTADAVRAVMGISESELPDDLLLQEVFSRNTERALKKISSDLVTNWETLKVSTDPKDLGLVDIVRDYCTYKIAVHVGQSIDLIAARTLTDSKATFQRFEVDLTQLIENLKSELGLITKELQEELQLEVPTYASIPLMGSGAPTYDPVTNEGA